LEQGTVQFAQEREREEGRNRDGYVKRTRVRDLFQGVIFSFIATQEIAGMAADSGVSPFVSRGNTVSEAVSREDW